MTDHTHTTIVEGCFRCELNKDEIGDVATMIGIPGETMKVHDLPIPLGRLHDRDTAPLRNQMRGLFAGVGVYAYAERTGVRDEPLEQTIKDLLGDLRHLCDAAGFGFDELVESSEIHYDAEIYGEG